LNAALNEAFGQSAANNKKDIPLSNDAEDTEAQFFE
jgi:hypothetical protein